LVAAIGLALLGAFALAEGFVDTGSDGRETWAGVETDRKRVALSRHR
jgi:hypothetical protein